MKQNNSQVFPLTGVPSEKQKQFFCAKGKYIAYGGARGGGKSWALRRKLLLLCLRYGGISALLLRRTYPELRENHIRPLLSELAGNSALASYKESEKSFFFTNGSRIKMGYCDSEADVLQYQGQEFDIIAIDEATQMTEYQFQTLCACLRGANDFPKRMYLTCNPGGVGHGWVKRLFIDREYRPGEIPSDYAFIPALVWDNQVLLQKNPDYVRQLEALPHELKQAWLFGKWDVFAGQFFPEFREDLHVVEPFPLSDGLLRFCAIDYGLDMLAALFVACGVDGCAYVYDEICEPNLIVSEAAAKIRTKLEAGTVCIAPSDLWSRQKDTGKSMAQLFSDNGIFLTKLTSARTDGWMCLKEWLKPEGESRQPRLKIFRSCPVLIRCLPQLMHDKDRAGDVSVTPHDITHAPDALRYFAVYASMLPAVSPNTAPVKLAERIRRRGTRSVL